MPRAHAFIFIAIAFLAGCFATQISQWFGSLDEPVLYIDVDDYMLKRAGFDFSRPETATDACMAFVGNGAGDTVIYLSFSIPKEPLTDFMLAQPNCKEMELSNADMADFPYRDTLPPKVAEMIMPEVLPDASKAYSLGAGKAVYDTVNERLHLLTY